MMESPEGSDRDTFGAKNNIFCDVTGSTMLINSGVPSLSSLSGFKNVYNIERLQYCKLLCLMCGKSSNCSHPEIECNSRSVGYCLRRGGTTFRAFLLLSSMTVSPTALLAFMVNLTISPPV
jgi:hypothetical protein